ncbi:MAG: glycerophosphodiester phosphodiesterase family protein [Hellea sp.]
MHKFARPVSLAAAIILAACNGADKSSSQTSPPTPDVTSTNTPAKPSTLPPLASYMSCLPKEAALIAAHRGTARNSVYPENSMSGLKALIEKGYFVAEVDVAGLKDGVHILYHDGIWDEKSTGKGPIASSSWADAGKILLSDTKGDFSADRPVKFEDYLSTAKGKIYLEIDFKSSAKYDVVINLIRKYDMQDQVILISYNEGQSKKLAALAPDMMLSIGSNEALGQKRYKPNQVGAWVGYNVDDAALIKSLQDKNVPILGRIRKEQNPKAAQAADLLVTDDVFDHSPIAGLNAANKKELDACLAKLKT